MEPKGMKDEEIMAAIREFGFAVALDMPGEGFLLETVGGGYSFDPEDTIDAAALFNIANGERLYDLVMELEERTTAGRGAFDNDNEAA